MNVKCAVFAPEFNKLTVHKRNIIKFLKKQNKTENTSHDVKDIEKNV